jgi:hypothetical protein
MTDRENRTGGGAGMGRFDAGLREANEDLLKPDITPDNMADDTTGAAGMGDDLLTPDAAGDELEGTIPGANLRRQTDAEMGVGIDAAPDAPDSGAGIAGSPGVDVTDDQAGGATPH